MNLRYENGRPWTPEERIELVAMRTAGNHWQLLANKFKRTVAACKSCFYGNFTGGQGRSESQDRRQARTRITLARGDESELLWTDAKVLRLGELLAAGATFDAIAADIAGVTVDQVRQKVQFGLSERVRRLIKSGGGKMRKCLCCQCEFLSEGKGNRLCSHCVAAAANLSPLALHEGSGGRRVRSVDIHIGNGTKASGDF